MIRTIALFAAIAFAFSTLAADAADATSSGKRTKIHRAKLRASMEKAQSGDSSALESCGSGNVDIGSIQVERGGRTPREVTVVVDGDVINLNDGRGSRICR